MTDARLVRASMLVLLGLAACSPRRGGAPGAQPAGAVGAADGGNPHVTVAGGVLSVDGVPTFLYGGDLHYFRVRTADFDAGATWSMWESSLTEMQAAGMNLVTTYIPWDYHNPSEGVWDFTGARDVGRFLRMACDKGFHVLVKPGPLITGEWPRGFGTFGAVPAWWKAAHPEALVRQPDGSLYYYGLGAPDQTQPTYLHPTYLAAVQDYFNHVLPILKPFLGGCLVGLQVDNETNLYWTEHYGRVDYSPTALHQYAQWLAQKYGTIEALNMAYGTGYADFASVQPPTSAPGPLSPRSANVAVADWYQAAEAYVGTYLQALKGMLVAAGFQPPDLALFTNDAAFELSFPLPITDAQYLVEHVLQYEPRTKDSIGLPALDLYPKLSPLSGALQDTPFQADFATRLSELHRPAGASDVSRWAFAAELQAGFFPFPVIGGPPVQPAATDQLLARTVGHGLKGGALYVMRDGLNADNSQYAYGAPLTADGLPTPRFDVAARWGGFLSQHGQRLLTATEVSNRILVLVDKTYDAPQGGILDDLALLQTVENPALYGWLVSAGYAPEVRDVRELTDADLSQYAVVFFQNPDFVTRQTATKLSDYVGGGGVLVNFLWPGRVDESFQPLDTLSPLFPASYAGDWVWVDPSRTGSVNFASAAYTGPATSYWYESYWQPPAGSGAVPFAWESTFPFGADGRVVGYTLQDGLGTRAFLGTNVFSAFNREDYYNSDPATLMTLDEVAQALVGLSAEQPILSTGQPRQLAWARRAASGDLYLFVINDDAQPAAVQLRLLDLQRLGLQPGAAYAATDALNGRELGTTIAAAWQDQGLLVPVAAQSTAVVWIRPASGS